MKLKYKAIYALIETSCTRCSLETFTQRYPKHVLSQSLEFAKQHEDYRYLSTMVSEREELDGVFAFFINCFDYPPVVVRKEIDFTFFEFCCLHVKANINHTHCLHLIESNCHNLNIQHREDEFKKDFDDKIAFIKSLSEE